MLYDTIKKNKIQAMKDKDSFKSKLLSTVLGESESKAKLKSNRESPEPSDSEILSVIDACLKTAKENLEKYNIKDAALEIQILSEYSMPTIF
jgi:uncharacterized protein YqeY